MWDPRIRILWIVAGALLTQACKSNDVSIENPFRAKPYNALTIDIFSDLWAEATSLERDHYEGEIAKDLRTRAPSDFDWNRLWKDFASSKLASPRNPAAEDILLSREIPKCLTDTVDSFVGFILQRADDSRLARKAICFVVSEGCPVLPSQQIWKELGKRLLSDDLKGKVIVECGGDSEALVSRYLDRSETLAAKLSADLDLESYFVAKMHNLASLTAQTRSNLDISENWERRTAPEKTPLTQRVLSQNLQLTAESFEFFERYWGRSRLIDLIDNAFYLQKFGSLDAQRANAFEAWIKVVMRASLTEWPKAYGVLSRWAESLSRTSLEQAIDGLDASIRQLTARVELLNPHLLDTLLLRVGESEVNFFQKKWIANHFKSSEGFDLGLESAFNETGASLINRVMALRLLARASIQDPSTWKASGKKICAAYADWGWSGRSAPWQDRRGCVVMESNLEIASNSDLDFSPDLIVFTQGHNLKLRVEGQLSYGIFDLSPDSLRALPQVPSPHPGPKDFDALVFNVILGISMPTEVLFVPFHFVGREGREVTEPEYQATPLSAQSGGRADVQISGAAILPTIVSHGGDGQAGTPPRMGGRGDCSQQCTDRSAETINRELQVDTFLQQRPHRFSRQLSGRDWREVLTGFITARETRTRSSIQLSLEMQRFLEPQDQADLLEYLEMIPEPPLPELRQLQKRLSAEPEYETLLNSVRLVPLNETLQIYRWRVLTSRVVDQLIRIGSEQDFSVSYLNAITTKIPHPFSQEVPFCVEAKGMSRPGKAPRSGDGGSIDLQSRRTLNPQIFVQPGIRFLWPADWNAGAYHGDIGHPGTIQTREEK